MKVYCLGFAFSPNLDWVVLIQKQRPDWQRGLLNGVGGHVEPPEYTASAMSREFKEETSVDIPKDDWKQFLTLENAPTSEDDPFMVFCFCTASEKIFAAKATTDEQVHIVNVKKVLAKFANSGGPGNLIYNIPSLVSMAVTRLVASRFFPNQDYTYRLIQEKA